MDLKQPSGKGQRLIVTHIGSEDGFVDGCMDVFRGRKTGNYLEETDGNHFEGWFNDVVQELPAEEKLPATAWKKEEIQEWLTSKNITYGERMIKKQLLELVASVKSRILSYIIDNTAVKNGITVDNTDFKLSMVDAILREKIKQVMAKDWRKTIQHVMDLEAKFRLDTSGSKHIQPIIIQLDQDVTEDCKLSGIEPIDEA
ncbi:hypothetical protein HPB50_013413 [Hyalomma asiaticum]|uniref:Uncharacterized protein n=1 Tax=Hyalomma asiaticum TaxID=266040 RepID=A0ACB7RJ21_HYAAI|nr:hypothetical protein HPB50_013413 [Hyalomma asiaticum]